MNYFKLKHYFIDKLSLIYEEREAEQIFFLVLEEVFSISKIDYALKKQEALSEKTIQKTESILFELKRNKPIQHILGYGYCYERRFKVTKEVLIPRQETEELIALILQEHKSANLRILDIGTGTGCIPINLKLENPLFNVSALDISEEALKIAKENAKDLRADVQFYQLDILKKENWNIFQNLSFDIIVSNPPYVRSSEKERIHKNVLDYDPHLALFVDKENPLIFYKNITKFSLKKLKNEGQLFFEINEAFGKEIVQILHDTNFRTIRLIKDLQGKDRMIYAIK